MPPRVRNLLQIGGMTLAAGLVPVALLELLQFALGQRVTFVEMLPRAVFSLAFALAIQLTSRLVRASPGGERGFFAALAISVLIASLVAAGTGGAVAAMVAVWAFFLLLWWLATVAIGPSRWRAFLAYGVAAFVAGLLPVLVAQIETRFAEEEFFAAVQMVGLSLFAFLLFVACHWLVQGTLRALAPPQLSWGKTALLLILAAPVIIGGAYLYLGAYQRSFFPPEAPGYPGVSAAAPFVCGTAPTAPQTYSGTAAFERMLEALQESPYIDTPEYGMLALATGEEHWAQKFRTQLLADAGQQLYTGPSNSVKWGQHAAALRAYYAHRIGQAFPELFSSSDWTTLQDWFAAINRRAFTVEWVDWMYAAAFAMWPEGPYENQEHGAGLLAILEQTGLAAPELHERNRRYLQEHERGWQARFRNTDDADLYQPEWITNALLQSLQTSDFDAQRRAQSFEWLLLQALPDGTLPSYNHIALPSSAPIAYLGATLVGDPRYLWLAARSLENQLPANGYIVAQPGVEQPIDLPGEAPTVGSCLLYGDSGLPNQVGPLAPDKIVFRDGWRADSAYLLLNLRFTGWHRYKATNAISLIYAGDRVISDILETESIPWLPVGRSLFRDKRIPRENLNGLLVENTGFSRALTWLTGIGSDWAQDPPFYAEVVDFAANVPADSRQVDRSHTRVTDWRGWTHDRWVYFYHDRSPFVVIDRANGPATSRAALSWQPRAVLAADDVRQRWLIGNGDQPLTVAVVPLRETAAGQAHWNEGQRTLLYSESAPGQLDVATVFLPAGWTEADVHVDWQTQPPVLRVKSDEGDISIPLE